MLNEVHLLRAIRNNVAQNSTGSPCPSPPLAGKAVRESGIPREEIFVTTKLWNSDHGYQNTLQAFHRSLEELGLDYGGCQA